MYFAFAQSTLKFFNQSAASVFLQLNSWRLNSNSMSVRNAAFDDVLVNARHPALGYGSQPGLVSPKVRSPMRWHHAPA